MESFPPVVLTFLLLAPIVSTSSVRSHLKVHDTLSITHLCRAIFSCFGRIMQKIPSEDESDTLHLDGEVTECSDQETDSETDVEDKPVHEEYRLNSNANVCIIHPFNL
ncbi:hypothetical protein AVEN_143413-1 [Araneus ventricosus]|uniref:Uncharacterized protein n=1 Tax=Araneus ventricosus TaxID=182803 RepID=A0A4Y2AFV7_ARAVE|nr:hypothetical protein AVEN_143413-1 [Araneus ventricosus]